MTRRERRIADSANAERTASPQFFRSGLLTDNLHYDFCISTIVEAA
jgi:hypothetical protein